MNLFGKPVHFVDMFDGKPPEIKLRPFVGPCACGRPSCYTVISAEKVEHFCEQCKPNGAKGWR